MKRSTRMALVAAAVAMLGAGSTAVAQQYDPARRSVTPPAGMQQAPIRDTTRPYALTGSDRTPDDGSGWTEDGSWRRSPQRLGGGKVWVDRYER